VIKYNLSRYNISTNPLYRLSYGGGGFGFLPGTVPKIPILSPFLAMNDLTNMLAMNTDTDKLVRLQSEV